MKRCIAIYLDKERGHPLRGVVITRDAVDHADRVDKTRNPVQHPHLEIKNTQINSSFEITVLPRLKRLLVPLLLGKKTKIHKKSQSKLIFI